MAGKKSGGKWMQNAVSKPGQLHKDLGVPAGKPLPKAQVEAAAKRPGVVGKRARLAETFAKYRKGSR